MWQKYKLTNNVAELGAPESVLEALEEPVVVRQLRLDLHLDLREPVRTHYSHSTTVRALHKVLRLSGIAKLLLFVEALQ
jgi:hypothetical protein